MKSRWNHAVCDECFERISDGESPYRLKEPKKEKCCACGNETVSGVYVRLDPMNTLCKGAHPDDETERIERDRAIPHNHRCQVCGEELDFSERDTLRQRTKDEAAAYGALAEGYEQLRAKVNLYKAALEKYVNVFLLDGRCPANDVLGPK